MIRRPPRSTLDRSSAASDVYKRQHKDEFRMALRSWDQRSDQKELDRRVYKREEGVYAGKFGPKRDSEDNT